MNRTSIGTTWKLLALSLLLALAATPAAFASDIPPIPPSAMPTLPDLAFTTVHMRDHDELAVINLGHTAAGPFIVTLRFDLGGSEIKFVPGLAPAPIYGGTSPTYLVGESIPLHDCIAVRIDAENLVHESNETNNIIKHWNDVCGNLGW